MAERRGAGVLESRGEEERLEKGQVDDVALKMEPCGWKTWGWGFREGGAVRKRAGGPWVMWHRKWSHVAGKRGAGVLESGERVEQG